MIAKTVWYFYKVKWGAQDEFLALFRKNHYPVLTAQLGGRLAAIRPLVPAYHGDTAAMVGPSGEDEITRRLFPDQETFKREERRRFELVDAHWDVPVMDVDLG
jgi:hypothetical protein